MRLILGLPPPHRPHFSLLGLCPVPVPSSAPVPAPVSVPAPALVPVPVPASSPFPLLSLYPAPVPASVPVPAPVSVSTLAPVSVSVPAWSSPPFPFPLRFPHLFSCLPRAGLCPSPSPRSSPRFHSRFCTRACPCVCSAPVSVPIPASVPVSASVLPRFCLSCSSFRSFQLPGTQSRLPQYSCFFSWISRYSVLLRFYPASFFFRFVRGGIVVFLNF